MPAPSVLFVRSPSWCRSIPKAARAPAGVRQWLFETGSLTRKVRRLSGSSFNLRVLRQTRAKPFWSEARWLGLKPGRFAMVREVVLRTQSTNLVLARTVLSDDTLRGLRRLARLGNRPLGEFLFRCPGLTRKAFELSQVVSRQWRLPDYAAVNYVWGRRTLYSVKGHLILVEEFFTPELLAME